MRAASGLRETQDPGQRIARTGIRHGRGHWRGHPFPGLRTPEKSTAGMASSDADACR
jgi:hypothetical protein